MNVKMNIMDVQADIKWIQQELNNVKDPMLIEAFKNLLKYRKKVFSSSQIDVQEYNKDIDEALEDIKEGKVHSHEEAGNIIRGWKNR
jgi:hypothetical protein